MKLLKQEFGKIIHSPFSPAQQVYVIKSGYIMAFDYDKEGRRRIHLIYGPGSYFPILTTFNERVQRATYETLTGVELEVYSKQDFLYKTCSDLQFCNEILHKTVGQLELFADRVVELQATRLEDKLLARLQLLAKSHGRSTSKSLILPYKLSHQHFADILGVERESVTRALTRLKTKNLIKISKNGMFSLIR